ncbi:MAG TPA: hypothetical protein VFU64_01600 [Gaiellaceae bacterium]|nr:hypothetical protein [Gaiellaceae bacterium]
MSGARPVVIPTPLDAEGSVYDQAIAFSPDGTQLVFSRAPFDNWEGTTAPPVLMAMSLDGGDPVPLAQSGIPGASLVPSDVQQAEWSPDGRWVAFVENETLEVAPTTGGAPRVLATYFSPRDSVRDLFSWSPNSKLLAYESCCSKQLTRQLITVRPDGTHLTDLLKDHRLAYDRSWRSGDAPQWSPDSSRLAFVAHRGHHRTQVWTIRADGRDLTRLG